MEKLILKPTRQTPGVVLESKGEKMKFEFLGTSCPLSVNEFFQPIMDWFDNLELSLMPGNDMVKKQMVMDLNIDYYNSRSAKYFFDIMTKMEHLNGRFGHNIEIKWFYNEEDEDIYELGYEFKQMLNIPFHLLKN